MPDVVVTIRMPATLVAELKDRTAHDHYADFSEQVRSVVRKGCLKYTNPVTHEIKELKEQLKHELLKERDAEKTEVLLAHLKELLAQHGGAK